MGTRIGINGFGRIGRNILRALIDRNVSELEVVAINDLTSSQTMAHLLRYDSVHGRFGQPVALDGETLSVGAHQIRLTAIRDPQDLPWSDVDIAFECTGLFTEKERAARHLQNGAKKVLVSAPTKGADRTVVFGVNHASLTENDQVISNASCTTNCLAPIAQVLDTAFGIETGYMTTIHAYTGDQPVHDTPHRDPYRGRAAALSMVPTSTGAARAISLVLPHLEGRLEGSAVRVPVPNVSLVDLAFMPKTHATMAEINAAIKQAADGEYQGIIAYNDEPLVSADFNHDPHSSCFAPAQTTVTSGGLVRVVSWYDNEWGFSNRMIDVGLHLGTMMGKVSVPNSSE